MACVVIPALLHSLRVALGWRASLVEQGCVLHRPGTATTLIEWKVVRTAYVRGGAVLMQWVDGDRQQSARLWVGPRPWAQRVADEIAARAGMALKG